MWSCQAAASSCYADQWLNFDDVLRLGGFTGSQGASNGAGRQWPPRRSASPSAKLTAHGLMVRCLASAIAWGLNMPQWLVNRATPFKRWYILLNVTEPLLPLSGRTRVATVGPQDEPVS